MNIENDLYHIAAIKIINEIVKRINELPPESNFVKNIYPKLKDFNTEIDSYRQFISGLYKVYMSTDTYIACCLTSVTISSIYEDNTDGFVYRFHESKIGSDKFLRHHYRWCHYRSRSGSELTTPQLQSLCSIYKHFPYLNDEEIIHWRLSRC
jgi:hypothetical protein